MIIGWQVMLQVAKEKSVTELILLYRFMLIGQQLSQQQSHVLGGFSFLQCVEMKVSPPTYLEYWHTHKSHPD